MKREAKILLSKAVESLILSVERFNCPWDMGRAESVLIQLDHAHEMLLKAAIIHKGGQIREKGEKNTLGFGKCVRKALTDTSVKFLSEDQALALDSTNSLRDAAQHYYLDITEDHLYLHAQGGLTLFRDIMLDVFGRNLAEELPERVLPVSTKVPANLITLFEQQVDEVKLLLAPGKRRGVEARAKLRALAIVENALNGEKSQPDDSDLACLERRIKNGEAMETLFPGVASINIVQTGEGPSLTIRIAKKEGTPVELVKEGTPNATVVAVKRVNELDFYNLSFTDLRKKLNLTTNQMTAALFCFKIKDDIDCHKRFRINTSHFDRYSQIAFKRISDGFKEKTPADCWTEYQNRAR